MLEPSSGTASEVLIPPLGDNQRLIALIASVTGESPTIVHQRLLTEEEQLGVAVQQQFEQRTLTPHVWNQQLIDLYKDTDAFLYESVVWNRTEAKLGLRRWIGQYLDRTSGAPQKILFYGDGLGFDCTHLAMRGHDVTYFEVSDLCAQFAKEVFRLSAVQLTEIRCGEDLPRGAYDVVVCLDVLEHVPDPPGLVRDFVSLLRPGGRLIVHAPFFFIHPSVSTHLRANRTYSGDLKRLYNANGLTPIDGRLSWFPLVLAKSGENGSVTRSRWWPTMLRLSGIPLCIARLWSAPHSWIAQRVRRRDPRWQEDLNRFSP